MRLLLGLFLFLSKFRQSSGSLAICQDKSPYCNFNDCTVRPGYSMVYCRKTCGNCADFCEDSKYITCSQERKKDCDDMLSDYCPKLCGKCFSKLQLKSKLLNSDAKPKRFKTIPVSQPNVGMLKTTVLPSLTSSTSISTSSRSPTIRLKQPRSSSLLSGPRMLPNGTFVSPPLPNYDKLDDNTHSSYQMAVPEYPIASMEELIPEPSRIWPEPEPSRIQPYQSYETAGVQELQGQIHGYPPGFIQPPSQQPTYQNSPWSPPALGAQPQQYQQLSSSSSFSSSSTHRRSPQTVSFLPNPHFIPSVPIPDPKLNTITIIPADGEVEDDTLESSMKLVEPFLAPGKLESKSPSSQAFANLINLLGCKDKDEMVCKYVTVETCLSRPGYYLKLCPVTCKNCSGLQCIDSIKINCDEVKLQGACKLSVAQEYCPRTCKYCDPPKGLAENMSDCKDELETCEQLAESGACEQDFGKSALRLYCAKSCGFCKTSQFYFSDAPLMSTVVSTRKRKNPSKSKMYKNNSTMNNKIFI